MNFLLDHWYLVLTALVSGGLLVWPSLSGARAGVGAAQAVQLMNREKAVVIDVRTPEEFAAGHIGSARNIPIAQLADSTDLPANKALPVVLVCASGMRSSKAAAILQKRGHAQALSLQGGMKAWNEAGLPVKKSA